MNVKYTKSLQNLNKMLELADIKLLEKELPPNYKGIIEKETGLSRTIVSGFFNGKKIGESSWEKIFDAAAKLRSEEKKRKKYKEDLAKELRENNAQRNLFDQ